MRKFTWGEQDFSSLQKGHKIIFYRVWRAMLVFTGQGFIGITHGINKDVDWVSFALRTLRIQYHFRIRAIKTGLGAKVPSMC